MKIYNSVIKKGKKPHETPALATNQNSQPRANNKDLGSLIFMRKEGDQL
jgi:hypothetical protein